MPHEYTSEGTPEYAIRLFPESFKGICIEIGAGDPFLISNSWLFENAGWDTYCIEPNPNKLEELKKYRKNVIGIACGSSNKDSVPLFVFSFVEELAGTGLIDHRKNVSTGKYHKTIFSRVDTVNVRTLDWLMENEIKQDYIDYLSIDVERSEMDVLRGINLLKWNPKVIVIENLDEEPEQRDYFKSNRYRMVHRIIYNDIYIQEDYYHNVVVPLGV